MTSNLSVNNQSTLLNATEQAKSTSSPQQASPLTSPLNPLLSFASVGTVGFLGDILMDISKLSDCSL